MFTHQPNHLLVFAHVSHPLRLKETFGTAGRTRTVAGEIWSFADTTYALPQVWAGLAV